MCVSASFPSSACSICMNSSLVHCCHCSSRGRKIEGSGLEHGWPKVFRYSIQQFYPHWNVYPIPSGASLLINIPIPSVAISSTSGRHQWWGNPHFTPPSFALMYSGKAFKMKSVLEKRWIVAVTGVWELANNWESPCLKKRKKICWCQYGVHVNKSTTPTNTNKLTHPFSHCKTTATSTFPDRQVCVLVPACRYSWIDGWIDGGTGSVVRCGQEVDADR